MDLKGVVDSMIPKSTDEEELRSWRTRVALVACSAWLFLFLILVPLIFIGVPPFGSLAWSEDVERQIQKAIEPIQADVTDIKRKVENQEEVEKRRQIRDLKQKIFETRVAQCKAKADQIEGNPYSQRLSDLQDEYSALTGRFLTLSECEDL
jgi:hypothetical protein